MEKKTLKIYSTSESEDEFESQFSSSSDFPPTFLFAQLQQLHNLVHFSFLFLQLHLPVMQADVLQLYCTNFSMTVGIEGCKSLPHLIFTEVTLAVGLLW